MFFFMIEDFVKWLENYVLYLKFLKSVSDILNFRRLVYKWMLNFFFLNFSIFIYKKVNILLVNII